MISEEKLQAAEDVYNHIKDLSTSPRDAAEIILIVHVTLWLTYRNETIPPEVMLAEYSRSFIENYRRNLNA